MPCPFAFESENTGWRSCDRKIRFDVCLQGHTRALTDYGSRGMKPRLPHGKTIVVFWLGRLSYRTSYLHIYYIISRTICQEVLKNNLNIISITKKRKPLSGKSWRGMPLGIHIIPLVCYLGLEPSSISKVSVGNTGHSFTRGLFPPFSACPFLGCDRRRNTY